MLSVVLYHEELDFIQKFIDEVTNDHKEELKKINNKNRGNFIIIKENDTYSKDDKYCCFHYFSKKIFGNYKIITLFNLESSRIISLKSQDSSISLKYL